MKAAEVKDTRLYMVGSDRVLFIHEAFFEKAQKVRLRLKPPRETGERTIESEHTWESATLNWFSVLADGSKYRMWHECYDAHGWYSGDDTSFCYAESQDGVRWLKLKLGLFKRPQDRRSYSRVETRLDRFMERSPFRESRPAAGLSKRLPGGPPVRVQLPPVSSHDTLRASSPVRSRQGPQGNSHCTSHHCARRPR